MSAVCYNVLDIHSEQPELLQLIESQLIVDDYYEDRVEKLLNFNNVIPMPLELNDTNVPSGPTLVPYLYGFYSSNCTPYRSVLYSDGLPDTTTLAAIIFTGCNKPEHVETLVFLVDVLGVKLGDTIGDIREYIKSYDRNTLTDDALIQYDRIRCDIDHWDRSLRMYEQHGTYNWYDWCDANWNTPYLPTDTTIKMVDIPKPKLSITFDTEEECPTPVIIRISEQYGVTITGYSVDLSLRGGFTYVCNKGQFTSIEWSEELIHTYVYGNTADWLPHHNEFLNQLLLEK